MAAESNIPTDIEIWIEKVINSCETIKHSSSVRRLINLYINRLEQEGMPYYQRISISDKLENLLWSSKENVQNKS